MNAIIQKVAYAKLYSNNQLVSEICEGVLIFVGVNKDDTHKDVDKLANKITAARIFLDEAGKINKNILSVNNEILLISNFTLQANMYEANRPDFIKAANRELALSLFTELETKLKSLGVKKVAVGMFGEEMIIDSQMTGPLTFMIDSTKL